MRRIFFSHFWLSAAAASGVVVAAACGTGIGLPPAGVPNFPDTIVLFALRGTSISAPSAYDVVLGTVAQTEQGELFDVAFDFDSTDTPVMYPAGPLGVNQAAGIRLSNEPFDSIMRAPTDGYVLDEAVPMSVGLVFIVRSRTSNLGVCAFLGALPRYGKFEVLDIDGQARSITLKLLIDVNCGYRGLQPGFPTS
ncbi:MAG: hypothetical protein ACE5HT_07820 [Gemmatimonadales bacterium]